MPVWQLLYIHLDRSRHPYRKCTIRRANQKKSAADLTAVIREHMLQMLHALH